MKTKRFESKRTKFVAVNRYNSRQYLSSELGGTIEQQQIQVLYLLGLRVVDDDTWQYNNITVKSSDKEELFRMLGWECRYED